MKFNFIIFCLSFFSFFTTVSAQKEKPKIKFGDVRLEDFAPKAYSIDSSANAVVIADIGSANFVGNKYGWFDNVYRKYERIRIMNQNGFSAATEKILLYVSGENKSEVLSDVKGAVYNLENGKIIITELDKKEIFETKLNKKHIEKKFTLPGVKVGSIIEISYTITSPFDFQLRSWLFQNTDYPRLWSEYQVAIPNLLNYYIIKHGLDFFTEKKEWQKSETFNISKAAATEVFAGVAPRQYAVSSQVNYYYWAMKDVPALKVESYITTPRNYIDEMEFQLVSTYNGETTEYYSSDWNKTAQTLLNSYGFSDAMEANVNAPAIDKAVVNVSNESETAKNIFNFIRDNYTCTDYNNFFVKTNLQNVIQSLHGNVGEINLLLINRLLKYGIIAQPVILSTRDFGFNYSKYPILEKFNYLICKVIINGNTYYLDATHTQLGFGNLTNACYNGPGIVINTFVETINISADSLKENKQTSIFIINGDKGMVGSVTDNLGLMDSYNLRTNLAGHSIEKFFENIKNEYSPPIELSNSIIDSLHLPENPITIKYDLKFFLGDDDIIYFNPLFSEAIKENPFKTATRLYPVEMPYCKDETYVLNMEIPKGYVVDELPKSVRVNLNETDGSFEYIIGKTSTNIQLRCRIKLNKANFASDDYQSLRDFYAFIVKKEAEQVVLKKIK